MPTVSWDTQHLTSPFNVTSRDGGSTEDLIIVSANGSDSGWLTCSARSVAGKTSNSMLLGVNCKSDVAFQVSVYFYAGCNCSSFRANWERKYLYYDIMQHKFCVVCQYDRKHLFSITIQNSEKIRSEINHLQYKKHVGINFKGLKYCIQNTTKYQPRTKSSVDILS